MAWPDSADPEYVKAYRRRHYLKNKEHENRGRTIRRRAARARQIAYLKKNGLWPVIPEHRLYEVPPNLRVLVLAKLIKNNGQRKPSRRRTQRAQESQEVLHEDRGGEWGCS
jgi:hypothetical protein